MSKVKKSQGKSKITTVIIILLILLVFIALGLYVSRPKKTTKINTTANKIETRSSTEIPQNTIIQTPTITKSETLTVDNKQYSIQYPNNWQDKSNEVYTNDGRLLYLQPLNNPNAKVVVEIMDANKVSIANMQKGFRYAGFEKSNAKIGKISADKYTGSMTLSGVTLHNSIYLFAYYDQIYLIKLSYKQSTIDPVLEKQFDEIVGSLQLR